METQTNTFSPHDAVMANTGYLEVICSMPIIGSILAEYGAMAVRVLPVIYAEIYRDSTEDIVDRLYDTNFMGVIHSMEEYPASVLAQTLLDSTTIIPYIKGMYDNGAHVNVTIVDRSTILFSQIAYRGP